MKKLAALCLAMLMVSGVLRRAVPGETGSGLLPGDGPDVLVAAHQAVRRLVQGHDLVVVLLAGGAWRC